MGALATFTFRVACLSAVGACDSPQCLRSQPWLDCSRPRHCPRRLWSVWWRRHSSWMRAPTP